MPLGRTNQIYSKFVFVECSECCRLKIVRLSKKSNVFPVAFHMPASFGKNQIVWVENIEEEIFETSGKQFLHSFMVVLWQGCNARVIHMDFVLAGQTRTFTGQFLQVR